MFFTQFQDFYPYKTCKTVMHHLIDSLLHILALINMSAMIFPFLLEIKGGSLKRLQSSYRLFAGGGGVDSAFPLKLLLL